MRLIWSNDSLDNMDRIKEYIGKDSKFYAKVFVEKIIQMADKLIDFPLMGRIVPEFNNINIRERIYRNYRIIYEIEDERIIILLVLHGSKQLIKDNEDL